MTKVACECGDQHECSAVTAPDSGAGQTTKTKRRLSPSIAAANEKRKAEAAARKAGTTTAGNGAAATAAHGGGSKTRSVLRELIGF